MNEKTQVPEINKDKIEFVAQRYYIVYIWSFFLLIIIFFLPVWIYDIYILNCPLISFFPDFSCPLASWEEIYSITLFFIFIVLAITGHIAKPWDPYLVITKDELQYKRFPFIIKNLLFDKFFWKTYTLSSIAAINLVIRLGDQEKPGFKLSGNKEDWEKIYAGISFDEYLLKYFGNNIFNFYDIEPLYKNQYLELIDQNNKVIDTLSVTYSLEEELKQLNTFLKNNKIPFFIRYQTMPDKVKEMFSPMS